MLVTIFDALTRALYGNIYLVVITAFIWGVLSIILSPCHLSSIPLLVAYIGGQGKISSKKAFFLSLSFAFGLLITIAVIGLVTGFFGRMLGDIGFTAKVFTVITAVIFFLTGLHFLGVIPAPDFLSKNTPKLDNRGIIPAFLLGLLFGVVLGPCTFGFMMPVLTVVFSFASTNIIISAVILTSFAAGHCLVIVFAGTFTEIVQNYLNWNEKSNAAGIVKKIFGLIIIVLGVYLVLTNFKIL